MDFELQPQSEAGRRAIRLAEEHARDFATRAEQHDRESSFPFENFAAMRESGLLAACVPEDLGGLGVTSMYDTVLCINRLGRGDGATAIGTNMHLASTWYYSRQLATARASGNDAAIRSLTATLRRVVEDGLIIAMIGSEPGTDLRHPLTDAVRAEGGWRVTGAKTFGTLSPIAGLFSTRARVDDGNGGFLIASLRLERDTPGLTIRDDWDALGMRASGSNSLALDNCFVPDEAITVRGQWGAFEDPPVPIVAMGLAAAFLGIAEAARGIAIEMATTRRSRASGRPLAERPTIQHAVAALEIDLAAARAIYERSALRASAFLAEHPPAVAPNAEWHAVYKDCQCAKWFVNRKAIEIVDQALGVSGGAGYMGRHPLSRLYRDVRAGPFMAPLTDTEAFEYIGKVTLGLDPTLQP